MPNAAETSMFVVQCRQCTPSTLSAPSLRKILRRSCLEKCASIHRQFLYQRRRSCEQARSSTRSALGIVFILVMLLLYKVQYKTGIEIVPLFPIDDSGFDTFNERLLASVDVSAAARQQPKKGFLFCWVMTSPHHHKTRLVAVNATWLPRCDAGHFYTSSSRHLDESVAFHTVFERLPDSYYKLFWKTRLALLYTYKHVSRHFDWYFKGDDDTYVVIETLKKYLRTLDSNKPYYIGYRLKRRMREHGYNAGGSGYVLSRAAMRIFAEELFPSRQLCPYHEWEDLAIARCLASKRIYPLDSRDAKGRQRFLPWKPEEHFAKDLTPSFIFDPIEHQGFDIFHENLISLHHLTPQEIRLIHGILYGLAKTAPPTTPGTDQ